MVHYTIVVPQDIKINIVFFFREIPSDMEHHHGQQQHYCR